MIANNDTPSNEIMDSNTVAVTMPAPVQIPNKKKKYDYWAYLWLAPQIILLCIFSFYPPIYSILLSFTDSTGSYTFNWIGLANFIEAFQSPIFWYGMRNIIAFTVVGLLLGNLMPFILAELLFSLKSKRLSSVFRYLFIIPILIPGVVNMMIWQYLILSSEPTAIMNTIVGWFGIEPQQWYYSRELGVVWFSMMFTGFPFITGTSFLIYLSGLQGISESVNDAAKLDGCTGFRSIIFIHLPYMLGQIKYFLITGIIGGIQGFNLQMVFVGDGVDYTATVPGYYMYSSAFGGRFDLTRYGYASAIGVIMFVLILGLTIINMKFINKKEDKAQ